MRNVTQPYERYRATDIEWCRKVPEHWDFVPVRRVGQVTNGGTPTSDDANWNGEIPFITPPDLRLAEGREVLVTQRSLTSRGVASGSATVPAGSIITSIRAPIGYVGRTVEETAFNQGCRAITPNQGSEARYAAYSLIAARDELDAQGRGTTFMEISAGQFLAIPVPRPPVVEQNAIADFLDEQTSRIDTLIAKQTQLIDTLRERRSAAMSTTLTCGLRSATLRPTGNPFIPSLPEGWTLTRFGREIAINEGQVDPTVEPWSSMTLVAPNHIESGTGRIIGRESASEQGADSGKYRVKPGQILYSKIRPALNKVTLATEDCLCSADMYAMSSRTGSSHHFVAYWMRSAPFHNFVSATSARVKMPKINREELAVAPWTRPPLEEQLEIVAHLDEQTSKMDALIAKTQEHITLAKERRAALITAAVTGQIDVRTAAPAEMVVA